MYLEKTLEKTINDLNVLTSNNKVLKKQIEELTENRAEIHEEIYYLENQMNDLNKYMRRNNIEIQNIPETILQKDLEEYVIKVLQSIGVTIDSSGLVAVHRLGNIISHKSHNVIVRFLNHKKANISLGSAKILPDPRILNTLSYS